MNSIPHGPMKTEIKQTYNDVEIVYGEADNLWRFTFRGRERAVDSLVKAKAIIDKPPPKDKKPFQRIPAYYARGYKGSKFSVVDVTSIACGPSWRGQEVWIAGKGLGYGDSKREKVGASQLFPVNAHNTEVVNQMAQMNTQIESLHKQLEKLLEKLKPLELPKDEEEK